MLSVSSLFLTGVGVYVGVCVFIHTHTHTPHVGYLDVSPEVGTRHLEGPKRKNIVTHGAPLDELPRNLSTAKCLLPRKPFKSLLVTMPFCDCGSCVAVMACTFEVQCFLNLEVRNV